MRKQEFLSKLKRKISRIPKNELNERNQVERESGTQRDEKSKQRNKIKAKVDSEIAIYDKLYICF